MVKAHIMKLTKDQSPRRGRKKSVQDKNVDENGIDRDDGDEDKRKGGEKVPGLHRSTKNESEEKGLGRPNLDDNDMVRDIEVLCTFYSLSSGTNSKVFVRVLPTMVKKERKMMLAMMMQTEHADDMERMTTKEGGENDQFGDDDGGGAGGMEIAIPSWLLYNEVEVK